MFDCNRGFSLLELLITVALIGILLSIAYPSYQKHLTSAHRKNAVVSLYDVAARLENYALQNNSYADVTLEKLGVKSDAAGIFYQLQIVSVDANSYLISAVPQNQQAANDQECGSLSLNEVGLRQISGSGSVGECWQP